MKETLQLSIKQYRIGVVQTPVVPKSIKTRQGHRAMIARKGLNGSFCAG